MAVCMRAVACSHVTLPVFAIRDKLLTNPVPDVTVGSKLAMYLASDLTPALQEERHAAPARRKAQELHHAQQAACVNFLPAHRHLLQSVLKVSNFASCRRCADSQHKLGVAAVARISCCMSAYLKATMEMTLGAPSGARPVRMSSSGKEVFSTDRRSARTLKVPNMAPKAVCRHDRRQDGVGKRPQHKVCRGLVKEGWHAYQVGLHFAVAWVEASVWGTPVCEQPAWPIHEANNNWGTLQQQQQQKRGAQPSLHACRPSSAVGTTHPVDGCDFAARVKRDSSCCSGQQLPYAHC